MKQALISAIVAAIVSIAALRVDDALDRRGGERAGASDTAATLSTAGATDSVAGSRLHYTDALMEDTWVDGARTTGSDRRTLTDAGTSICYLTKVEIKGVQSPADSNACAVEIDDFTGFWELIATVEEGGQSEVRCNARCLTWE